MKQVIFRIRENEALTADVYRMNIEGDVSAVTAPGQFVNIRLEGKYLRRPISVCDRTENGLTLIYKTVGAGTEQMSRMLPGQELDILTGLGNGYDLTKSGDHPLLIGGGVGIPPLYWLCRELTAQGKDPVVILGFNRKEEVFFEEQFRELAGTVLVMTADGSYGNKGFVTDGMKLLGSGSASLQEDSRAGNERTGSRNYSYIYTCGPMPMFRAINQIAETSGQFSFEERMGCGFGACMGCSCKTVTGYKRICKDGPVLEREEILW